MAKKEHSPDKLLQKFHAFRHEAKESGSQAEYSFVRYAGDDSDGVATWTEEGAESDFRNQVPGRYAIMKEEAGDSDIMREATVTDSGQRALARRQSGGSYDPEKVTSAAIARAFTAMSEGFTNLATIESRGRQEYEGKYKELLQENCELKAENAQLKIALEQDETIPSEIVGLIDKGLSMFAGHATRKLFKERFSDQTFQAKVVEAIGFENAVKVAKIMAEALNEDPDINKLVSSVTEEESE